MGRLQKTRATNGIDKTTHRMGNINGVMVISVIAARKTYIITVINI